MKNGAFFYRGGAASHPPGHATFVSVLAALVVSAAGSALAGDTASGIALYEQKRYAEAEAALRGVEGVDAKAYLAASLAKQRKYAEAEAPAGEALKANATHDMAVAALGEALVGQDKFDAAIERMSAVIGARPTVAYAYYWRGKAYNAKKQPARMIDDLQAFLKLAPKAPEAPAVQQLLAALK